MKLVFRLILLIIGLLLFFQPFAKAAAGKCEVFINKRPVLSKSLRKVFPGVLFEFENGARLLAYTQMDFGSGHSEVIDKVMSGVLKNNPIKRVLWIGELEFQASGRTDTLIGANEVSGTFAEASKIKVGYLYDFIFMNDIGELRNFLRERREDASLKRTRILTTEGTKFFSYQENPQHLDPETERLRQILDSENSSHAINSVLQGLKIVLKSEVQPDHDRLMSLLPSYAHILEIFGHRFSGNTDRLIEITHKALETGELKGDDLRELKERHSSLLGEWKGFKWLASQNTSLIYVQP